MIGERVRDKIAASKRKGILGRRPGPPRLSQRRQKLEVVADDAALVKKIFGDYLRLRSIGALAAALDREGVRPKPRLLAKWRDRRGRALHGGTARAYAEEPLLYWRDRLSRRSPSRRARVDPRSRSVRSGPRATFRALGSAKAQEIGISVLSRGTDLRRSRQPDEPQPRQQEGGPVSLLRLAGAAAES